MSSPEEDNKARNRKIAQKLRTTADGRRGSRQQ
jgi:hypothetical protein